MVAEPMTANSSAAPDDVRRPMLPLLISVVPPDTLETAEGPVIVPRLNQVIPGPIKG